MKNLSAVLFLFMLSACGNQEAQKAAKLPKVKSTEKVAVFAGGCFWGIQEAFSQLKGVEKVTSGYAGGTTKDPTYEQVNTQTTGHAEAVQIVYDPSVISFEKLTEVFFVLHDSTQLNRQGPDTGTNYRSIAFYSNGSEKKQIEAAIVKANNSQLHPGQTVTAVEPLSTFYPAEQYHQNYARLHPDEIYVATVCEPKVEKLVAKFPELLKEQHR